MTTDDAGGMAGPKWVAYLCYLGSFEAVAAVVTYGSPATDGPLALLSYLMLLAPYPLAIADPNIDPDDAD